MIRDFLYYGAIDGFQTLARRAVKRRKQSMRRYDYACGTCDQRFDIERPTNEAGAPAACPFCGAESSRVYTAPKFLFKADPGDNRPVWHNHGGFGHAHPPRRGYHPPGVVDES